MRHLAQWLEIHLVFAITRCRGSNTGGSKLRLSQRGGNEKNNLNDEEEGGGSGPRSSDVNFRITFDSI